MKNQVMALGATLLFAAPFATPALADPSGFISLGAGPGSQFISNGSDEDSEEGYAIRGAASGVYNFTPTLGVQGDLSFTYTSIDDDAFARREIDGALHGFYREPDNFLVGGFVQLGRDTYLFDGDDEGSTDRAYIGGEAQVYLDNLTLYAQGGMQQFTPDLSFAPTFSGWFGQLEARYFLTPDFRIEAHVGANTLDFLGSYTVTTVNLGIGAEYKLENLPVSLFAAYDYRNSTIDDPDAPTFGEHRLLVGAKFAIGEESLLGRDRNGASLSPVNTSLPLTFGGFGAP
ncbi:MAG: hypothetical protein EOP24_11380 [Hyphomicrobiales bacterium]|nr:MAG: hypothetical protein EOP24_11380 [Hyphomicrobiales bacterium]